MTIQTISVSDATIARMKSHAEPLVDTYDSIINRAFDALDREVGVASETQGIQLVSPATPPNLAFTTVHSVTLDGVRFPPSESYWNHLMYAVIRLAGRDRSPQELLDLIVVNSVIGRKENNGYRFLEDVGVSVQGQDANGAWKAVYNIARTLKISVQVTFSWQSNPKAAAPGAHGAFNLSWPET